MNNKLTLSINQTVIEKANKYAKSSGKSFSIIVKEYLKSLTFKEKKDKKKSLLRIVRELQGSVKVSKDFTFHAVNPRENTA